MILSFHLFKLFNVIYQTGHLFILLFCYSCIIIILPATNTVNILFMSDSEQYRKMLNTYALPTKTVQWTRGGETAASSAVFRNVWQWAWLKKVRLYHGPLKLSVTYARSCEVEVSNDSLVKPMLRMTDT